MRRFLTTLTVLTILASAATAGWIVYHGDPAVSPADRVRAAATGEPAHPTTRAEVRKLLGQPVVGDANGTRWAYPDVVVGFAGDKVVSWQEPQLTDIPSRTVKTIDVPAPVAPTPPNFRGVVSPSETRQLAYGSKAKLNGRVYSTATGSGGDDYVSDEAFRREMRDRRGTNSRFDYLRQSVHRSHTRNRNFSHRGAQQWWR